MSEPVQSVQQARTIKGHVVDENGEPVLRFTRERVSYDEKMAYAKRGIAVVDFDDIFMKETIDGQTVYRYRKLAESSQNIYRSYPKFNKYRIWDGPDSDVRLLTNPTAQVGFADVPVMRYAEMPLIAAEAQIGLGNKNEAASIINREIRTARVVKPGHNLSEAQVSANDMTIEWILDERGRELCGEWLRWFDLKRTKKLVSYKRVHNPATNGDNPVSDTNYLWPIPTSFLDKLENAEEFGQNPGYNPYTRAK